MDRIIDFTNCRRVHRAYGGSGRKISVLYGSEVYLLKFAKVHAGKHDASPVAVNNIISEYLGSHIAESIGIPAHRTHIGSYKNEAVVGCRDFRGSGSDSFISLEEYMRALYGRAGTGRRMTIEKLYDAIKDPRNDIPTELQRESIDRFWEIFVVDVLVENRGRSPENLGYLLTDSGLKLSPACGYSRSLRPDLSDEQMMQLLENNSLIGLSSNLSAKKDILLSGVDKNCAAAVLRIAPRIDLKKIDSIIDETPLISNVRKEFYRKFIRIRKKNDH